MTPKMRPTAKAIIGAPRNFKISAPVPLIFAIEATEERAMRMIGTIIGAMAVKPFGRDP